jgi:hypothetical protein
MALLQFRKNRRIVGLVWATVATNLMLNLFFYPRLLRYQSPTIALEIMRTRGGDQARLATYKTQSQAMDFYSATGLVPQLQSAQTLNGWLAANGARPAYLFTSLADWTAVRDSLPRHEILHVDTLNHYHVTMLRPAFLNRDTRPSVLEKKLLITLKPR